MLLQTGKLQYQENGAWVDVQELISLDITYTDVPSRAKNGRKGIFINDAIDSVMISFVRGNNKLLDSILQETKIPLKFSNGALTLNGEFIVSDKINVKKEKETLTTLRFIPNNESEFKLTSNSSGVSSGVQDVQLDGKSIVDSSTGIAEFSFDGLTTKAEFKTAVEEVTNELKSLNNYCDSLDATKAAQSDLESEKELRELEDDKLKDLIKDKVDQSALDDEIQTRTDEDNAIRDLLADKADAVNYIELTGTSGTLTSEQRETLLKGSPTLNFIDKDGMIFKCVFYSAGNKAVFSIAGESKIHVIEVNLSTGNWTLTTYNLASTYTAGDNIEIKNNKISTTGAVVKSDADGLYIEL